MDSEFPWTDKSKLHDPLKEFDPAAFAKEFKERAAKSIRLPSRGEQPTSPNGPQDLVYRSTDPKPEISVGPYEPSKDREMPPIEQLQLQATSTPPATSGVDDESTADLGNAGFELSPEDAAAIWEPRVEADDSDDADADDGISEDDGSDVQQQPYFQLPQSDGGAVFSPGSSIGDVGAAADFSSDFSSDGFTSGDDASSLDDPIADDSEFTTDSGQDSEGNAPDSPNLSPRATGLLQNTTDGGPPLARPVVLLSLSSAATQRLIEESLSAASQRDSQTLESIAKAKVHDAFWIRDAQRRAVTGDW